MGKLRTILLRILLYIPTVVIMAGSLVYFAFQLPEVQTRLTREVSESLSKRLGGTISVGHVRITWLDEITIEDINIKDLSGRDMIFVRELYVNCKNNFTFSKKKIINFDNNLDFLVLKDPDVKLIKEEDGQLNIDLWIAKINELQRDPNSTKTSAPDQNIPFTIDNAIVQGGHVSLIDHRKKRTPRTEFDYNNFKFDQIYGNLKDILILGDTVAFKAEKISGKDLRSKLDIKNIRTDFLYCKTAIVLDHLEARINNSLIRNYLRFDYARPSAFNNFEEKVFFRGHLKNSILDAQDLGRFVPIMYRYKESYLLSTELKGRFVDLHFNNFEIRFGKNSNLTGTAHFKGFPNLRKTYTKLSLKSSHFSPYDILQYQPDNQFKNYVNKIGELEIAGRFEGYYNRFATVPTLKSSNLGLVKGDIQASIPNSAAPSQYKGFIDIERFELGKWVENKNLGVLSFIGRIDGQGVEVKNAKVKLDGNVKQIYYQNYLYKNMRVNGSLGHGLFEGALKIDDQNLKADIGGKVDFNTTKSHIEVNGYLLSANLKKLGYTSEDVHLRSQVNLNVQGNQIDEWIGQAYFFDTRFTKNKQILAINELRLLANRESNFRQYKLRSEFLDMDLDGIFLPSVLWPDLQSLFKNLVAKIGINRRPLGTVPNRNYHANYSISFKDTRHLFAFFMPEVYVSNQSLLEGKISFDNSEDLSANLLSDTLILSNQYFYKNKIELQSSHSSEGYLTGLIWQSDSQNFNQSINTDGMQLNAYLAPNDRLKFDGHLTQNENKATLKVLGEMQLNQENIELRFNPEKTFFQIKEQTWQFSPNNIIRLKSNDYYFENCILSKENEKVSLNGWISDQADKEASFTLQDFELSTLKPLLNGNIQGIANGEIKVHNYFDKPIVVSNLNIDELVYNQVLIGTVIAKAHWDNLRQRLAIDGNIYRINQEILRLQGYYDPNHSQNPLELEAELKDVPLNMFEGLLVGTFSHLDGVAKGNVQLYGSPSDPKFKGRVKVDHGALHVVSSGADLYFDDEIVFDREGFLTPKEGIVLHDNTINPHTALLKGGLYHGGSGNFMIGLSIKIDDPVGFRIMNLDSKASDTFYGTAYATGNLQINGDLSNLDINANLTSQQGTKIYIPLDGKAEVNIEDQGIIFREISSKVESKGNTEIHEGTSVIMNFNLNLNENAEGEIIFDRTNNDILNVVGKGRLNINYDTHNESFTIFGPYEMSGGKYNFSFQNLSSLRKFNLIEGSKIIWSGDPYEAQIDMRAQYQANIPLNKISGTLGENTSRYPVVVMVNLKDRLLNPKVDYSIHFDTRQVPFVAQTDILAFEQRLKNDEQLLSRNVSSILVLNEIFPENFAEGLTQQFLIDNVSNIISNQIGNLANKFDPNLEFGVQFGDLQQSILNNLQLNFSYKFFDNRIKLSGQSSFVNSFENSLSNTNGGTVQNQLSVGGELEYLLSPNGEYKFKLYSRTVPTNYYIFASSGNVLVSGGSLIFTKNFNRFFHKEVKSDFYSPVRKIAPIQPSPSLQKPSNETE